MDFGQYFILFDIQAVAVPSGRAIMVSVKVAYESSFEVLEPDWLRSVGIPVIRTRSGGPDGDRGSGTR